MFSIRVSLLLRIPCLSLTNSMELKELALMVFSENFADMVG